jgi:hypothetical protein
MSQRAARENSRESIEARIQMEEAGRAQMELQADAEEDMRFLAEALDEFPERTALPDSSGISNRGKEAARRHRSYGERSWGWDDYGYD